MNKHSINVTGRTFARTFRERTEQKRSGLQFPECTCSQWWCWWSVFAASHARSAGEGDVMGLLKSCFPVSCTRCWRDFSAPSRPLPPNCLSAPTIWRACVRRDCGRGASRGNSRSTTTRVRATGWVWLNHCRSSTKHRKHPHHQASHYTAHLMHDDDADAVTWLAHTYDLQHHRSSWWINGAPQIPLDFYGSWILQCIMSGF